MKPRDDPSRMISLTFDKYAERDSDVYITITKKTENMTQTMRMTLTEFMGMQIGIHEKAAKVKPWLSKITKETNKEEVTTIKPKKKKKKGTDNDREHN